MATQAITTSSLNLSFQIILVEASLGLALSTAAFFDRNDHRKRKTANTGWTSEFSTT
ncbi:hypothetical protein HPP92_014246 [Vanilla planifolia]|uniref:Uncharacterized protein n=1 Tax=Vanilla planifolia TaxID=51239 RepID=A0A835QWB4_VANPL|nr:hypothetical protein HPP92_014246 [Vanilla planifolia]